MLFPAALEVVVEMPRASFVKRRDDGAVDFVSPLPCPFNYGSIPDTRAADGDREDVIVLGTRLPKGTRLSLPVLARAHFIDAGVYDGKWICGAQLRSHDRVQLAWFFSLYALAKRVINRSRGLSGTTCFSGLELAPRER
ncbi:MAG: inorganic diphosphatase [Polyangiales bacterium]